MSQKKLNDRDARAIDALLMNGRNMDNSLPFDPSDMEPIRAAAKVLGLLDLLPIEEPVADLAKLTLQRINGSSGPFTPPPEDRPLPGGPSA